jgi:hypothetical protein
MLQEHCHQASPERSLDYIVLSFILIWYVTSLLYAYMVDANDEAA